MTLRFPRVFLLAAATLVLAGSGASLTAQTGESGEVNTGALRKAREKLSDKQIGDMEAANSKWAQMTPEERLNASIRRDARGQCRFVAACRPPKLMPGESGTLLITAILQGAAVLPAPLQMIMTPRVKPESVAIGDMMARPAQPGVLAKGYLGRPVYENTAILEVPITMGNTAKVGSKQPVAMDLQFDIYDGTSAQVVGRFVERVATDIEVGKYIDPVVAGRTPKAAPEENKAVKVSEPAVAPEKATDVKPVEYKPTPVNVPQPVDDTNEADVPEPVESGDLPTTEEEGGMPFMLVGGLGVFLLLIVALMMRKK